VSEPEQKVIEKQFTIHAPRWLDTAGLAYEAARREGDTQADARRRRSVVDVAEGVSE